MTPVTPSTALLSTGPNQDPLEEMLHEENDLISSENPIGFNWVATAIPVSGEQVMLEAMCCRASITT